MSYSTDEPSKASKRGRVNLTQPVSWWIRSNDDPRWNSEGSSLGPYASLDIFATLENMERDLGERPDDLYWGYDK